MSSLPRMFMLALLLAAGCNFPARLPATPSEVTPEGPQVQPATSTFTPAPTPLPLPGELTPVEPSPTWTVAAPPASAVLTPDASGWAVQVVLADGRCCVGGIVGDPVDIPLAFQASGPGGPAAEVRYKAGGGCLAEADLAQEAWKPFTAQATLQTRIQTINWLGFYVSAQFRDPLGNVSPVVCDDISMEGQPAPPTSTP